MKARDVQELQRLWAQEEPKRAKGGFWALSGFNVQMLISLETFVRRILVDRAEVDNAAVEQLSDALLTEAGGTRLIQVKRKLTAASLASAVREAYQIASYCSPSLLETLTFQIACEEYDPSLDLSVVAPKSPVRGNQPYDPALLAKVLERFDASEPIKVAANPLLALHRIMVLAGVQDPASVVIESLGRIFGAFGRKSLADVENAVFDVIRIIKTSIAQEKRILRAGRLLTPTMLAPQQPAGRKRQSLIFGRRPRMVELVNGQFRTRSFFDRARGALREWLGSLPAKIESDDAVIHVFWIKGRPGDGKSVLLLQLAADLVTSGKLPFVTELQDMAELQEWMESSPPADDDKDVGVQVALVGLIDDLHEKVSAGQLDAGVAKWAQHGLPANALITCGPTIDLEAFQPAASRLSIVSFEVPLLEPGEMEEFRVWYEARTGSTGSRGDQSTANRLLIDWLLTLATDEPAVEFAANLRNTLTRLDIFDASMAIAAANALDIGAPVSLLKTARQRRSFERLSAAGEGHFELRTEQDEQGLYLSHPELVWPLFKRWATIDGDDVPSAWGTQLGRVLIHLLKGEQRSRARAVLGRIIDKRVIRARFGTDTSLTDIKAIQAHIIDAAFETALSNSTHAQLVAIMPLWLFLQRQGLLKAPASGDLRASAAALLSDAQSDPASRTLIACALAAGRAADTPAVTARTYLISQPATAEANAVVQGAFRGAEKGTEPAFVLDWLRSHLDDPGAAGAFAYGVTRSGQPAAIDAALEFVRCNSGTAEASPVVLSLIRHMSKADPDPVLCAWVKDSPDHHMVARVLDELLEGSEHPARYQGVALDWLEQGHRPSNVHETLKQLIKFDAADPRLQRILEEWIPTGLVSMSQAHTLAELVKSPAARARWTDTAIRAARLAGRQERILILAELLRYASAPAVFQMTLSLLLTRKPDSAASFLFAVLAERLKKMSDIEVEKVRETTTASGRYLLRKALAIRPRRRKSGKAAGNSAG